MGFGGSRDVISGLPDDLICHIFSFLPTKEAASTSVLSKRWKDLLAFVPNLDFDDSIYLGYGKEKKACLSLSEFTERLNQEKNQSCKDFMDFVDKVLALQGNFPVNKFSLNIKNRVVSIRIIRWISNVLERRVSFLDLRLDLYCEFSLPSQIFMSETLVTLKIKLPDGSSIDVEHVHLPNLKTLYIHSAEFEKMGIGLAKLLSGCRMLEDLVLKEICWYSWESSSVSATTLKRLKFRSWELYESPKSVSFDTPNLVYIEYHENIADKYPKVNFNSLVEANIGLSMTEGQREEASFTDLEENDFIRSATDFIKGICNVKILYLSADTLEVLAYCCDAIPLFKNLTHLTIESNPEVGWESLPAILKNSPNLEILVFQGLVHKATNRCGDVCLCEPNDEEEEEDGKEKDIQSCLSSSPVKVIKILKFLEGCDFDEDMGQVKYFLETMPNLEQMMVYYDTPIDEDVIQVSKQLEMVHRVASAKCIVQLISNTFNLSSTLSTNGLHFFTKA